MEESEGKWRERKKRTGFIRVCFKGNFSNDSKCIVHCALFAWFRGDRVWANRRTLTEKCKSIQLSISMWKTHRQTHTRNRKRSYSRNVLALKRYGIFARCGRRNPIRIDTERGKKTRSQLKGYTFTWRKCMSVHEFLLNIFEVLLSRAREREREGARGRESAHRTHSDCICALYLFAYSAVSYEIYYKYCYCYYLIGSRTL